MIEFDNDCDKPKCFGKIFELVKELGYSKVVKLCPYCRWYRQCVEESMRRRGRRSELQSSKR